MAEPVDKIRLQAVKLRQVFDIYIQELEGLMSDKKIVQFPVNPDDASTETEELSPRTVTPRPGGFGGCLVLGSAYHGPDGEDKDVELKPLSKENEVSE